MDGIYAFLNTFSVYYNNKFNIMSAVKLNMSAHTGLQWRLMYIEVDTAIAPQQW